MDNRKRLPTPATVAPGSPEPLPLDDRGSGGLVREGAPGGAAQGVGAPPHAGSALGAGRRPGAVFIWPLGGPDIGIPMHARPTLIADKHSRSLCL